MPSKKLTIPNKGIAQLIRQIRGGNQLITNCDEFGEASTQS